MSADALVTVDRTGAVGLVTLDRPAQHNALSTDVLLALARALRTVRRDAAVRALVVTGAGEKAFSAGADIAAMAAMTAEEGHAFSRLGHEVLRRLEELPVPVVAAVNGIALGGGCELALACDLVVASEKARLGQPEVNLGIIPGFGGTQRLALRVGMGRARDLVLTGRQLGAVEALAIGLVDRVVPPERVLPEATALAAELAAKSPVALRQAKRALLAAGDSMLGTGLRYEVEAFGAAFASEDRVEGMRAFVERRPPRFTGR